MLRTVQVRLALDFSSIDIRSDVIGFSYSDYYTQEMGSGLLRQWVSTSAAIEMTELVAIKHFTNRLEQLFARQGARTVNIDPGYATLAKVVLATTKDYDHRLYIGNGIYEEVTLHYRRKVGFESWPWTYPDYKSDTALEFFSRVRQTLHAQIEAERSS